MTLAKTRNAIDDETLMQIMVEAYPVIVFTRQLEDRSRKITEIIEGEEYADGRLCFRSLYSFDVADNITGEQGQSRVIGRHKKTGNISDTLRKRLLDNGISHKELDQFVKEED